MRGAEVIFSINKTQEKIIEDKKLYTIIYLDYNQISTKNILCKVTCVYPG